MSLLDRAARAAIKCYKVTVSPHKGYKCAYSVTHGISCSTVADKLIEEHGVINARPFIKQQFTDCRAEFEKLQEDQPDRVRSSGGSSNCHFADGCHLPMCWGTPSRRNSSDKCDVDICDIDMCD